MVWRIRGGNLHEISARMQWNRSRDLNKIQKIYKEQKQKIALFDVTAGSFHVNSRSTAFHGCYVLREFI